MAVVLCCRNPARLLLYFVGGKSKLRARMQMLYCPEEAHLAQQEVKSPLSSALDRRAKAGFFTALHAWKQDAGALKHSKLR